MQPEIPDEMALAFTDRSAPRTFAELSALIHEPSVISCPRHTCHDPSVNGSARLVRRNSPPSVGWATESRHLHSSIAFRGRAHLYTFCGYASVATTVTDEDHHGC